MWSQWRGEIDASNAAAVGRELSNLSNRVRGLIVDLCSVRHLDSTGIALLYDLHLRLARRGQSLALIAPVGGAARRVLELCAFDTRTPVVEEVALAFAGARAVPRG